ncbi:hypothetical protein HPB49_005577 [Dermacentor silvarum]|uniref:Uncharacterized protein n=1 Tax=Dermacentor silvarum TaxID=543639 RepID=A0ACB8C7D6_DERSI|nr:hypothetical protein HPB49_005577 [Dermacentor silvarum]
MAHNSASKASGAASSLGTPEASRDAPRNAVDGLNSDGLRRFLGFTLDSESLAYVHRCRRLPNDERILETSTRSQASGAPARKKAAEPTPRQRGRLLAKNSVASNQPRLPSNALKLIARPRGGLLLSKISTYQLLEAICMAARFTRDAVRHQDLIKANLIQNTFAYCTPDVQRAEQVLRLKAITIDNKEYEVSVYCAPGDSSGRGVIRGVDLRLDRDTIHAELQDNRNPAIVDFRRLGNTTAVLITFAQPQVPTWVYFCNSRHRCNLFKKKYEVCYHCGELGHRADVCASPTTKCRGCGL